MSRPSCRGVKPVKGKPLTEKAGGGAQSWLRRSESIGGTSRMTRAEVATVARTVRMQCKNEEC